MAKMLQRELDDLQKALLAQLTLQPGWKIVEEMLAEFCAFSTAAVIQLEPGEERYTEKLTALQIQARVANDICSSLLRSVKALVNDHVQEAQVSEQSAELIRKAQSTVQSQRG